MSTTACTIHIANSAFDNNNIIGSLYIFSSDVTFSGYKRFENCIEPSNRRENRFYCQEGGGITSFQSTVTFTGPGISTLVNNQARRGGAIVANEFQSKITMHYTETIITNNTATNGNVGGISLYRSDIEIRGYCMYLLQ